ncbi:MAG: alpha/beta hydrolase [Pseudomonadota bacterium]
MRHFLLFAALLLPNLAGAETVTFSAEDGVTVTADLSRPDGDAKAVIVLFHMAGASRGEYRDIAPRLLQLGYATLAVDQRSGGAFNGVTNATVKAAGGSGEFIDAVPDMKAAAAWARQNIAPKVAVIGSSYSAALVLVLSGRDPEFADAVMAFSPGEYFGSSNFVRDALEGAKSPIFMTAARSEQGQWQPFAFATAAPVTPFQPNGAGRHGATALVSADGVEYWAALEKFLAAHFPPK